MTLLELAALFREIASHRYEADAAIATAMARYIAKRTREDTLQRTKHSPGAYYRARPGAPPAYASGTLARGMEAVPAHTRLRGTAWVRNQTAYARILEFGCVVVAHNGIYLGWRDTGRADNPSGIWRHREVKVPPHPYLGPTVDEAIADGTLLDVAVEAFIPFDP